jgi:all-trans-retinol 13,14-reductase
LNREVAVVPAPAAPTTFDAEVIVVGSGIGGLTAASLLAQLAHKRVLLLERHFKLGGFSHTFRRGGFTFDPGLHYVGDMEPGSQSRTLMDLVTAGQVGWHPMASPFERFVYPDLCFEVPSDPLEYAARLRDTFPAEADAIARYFKDVERASGWFRRHIAGQLLPAPAGRLLDLCDGRFALQTTAAYLETHFRDARLKALLTSQWPDYGLPPSLSSFAIHSLVVGSYLHGGWYPIGGAGKIAAAVARVVGAAGGACLVNHEVNEILLEDGIARGVRVTAHHGQNAAQMVFRAPLVISDAGAMTTYAHLLPPLGLPEQRALEHIPTAGSTIALYLGLKDDPARLGVTGPNYWVYSSFDHDATYNGGQQLLRGQVSGCYMTFPSTLDPLATAHTAQIHAWVKPEQFAAWSDRPWLRRGDDYQVLKDTVAGALLEYAERQVPGLRDTVAMCEVSTPLSVEHFTGHPHGAMYGLPATPERLRHSRFGPRSPIRGLLLAGADVAALGIVGAMMGGVLAAATVLGVSGFPRITRAAEHAASSPAPAAGLTLALGRSGG